MWTNLNLEASLSLLSYLKYKQLGQDKLKPTYTTLPLLVNLPISHEVVQYVHVELDKFYNSLDFIIF